MCEPATIIAGASLAAGLAGTAMTVSGQMNAQASAGAQAKYMQQVQLQQQQVAEGQARDAVARGAVNEQRTRDATGQRLGTQTAELAGQGTDLSGSPTDILTDTRKAGELDALTVRNNAAREAFGYEVQGSNAAASAQLSGSFTPSNLGAGASLLSGASSLADKWSKFKYTADAGSPSGSSLSGNVGGSYGGYSGAGEY